MQETPTESGHALASSVAKRQGRHLVWSAAGVICLLFAYVVGLWMQRAEWVTQDFPKTVLWCAIPYGLAAYWLYGAAAIPATERLGMLFVTTSTPFILTPLGFALLQHPYSRGALAMTYGICLLWFFTEDVWQTRRHERRFAYLDKDIPDRLAAMIGTPCIERHAVQFVAWPARDIDGVVLERNSPMTESRRRLLSLFKLQHIRLYSVESLAELLSGRKILQEGEDAWWELDGAPAYDVFKRFVDVALVLASAPLWLPVCLGTAFVIKADSPGPILFSQMRTGLNGRSFRLWKFRSMRTNEESVDAQFALPADVRVTRSGRWIRRYRLDELPQFWNVLKGDMSLIGPRPEQTQLVDQFARRIPAYPYRHLVRPGITGWAQVLQGYAGNEQETTVKLSYDLYYVSHYSIALDLLIALKTLRILLSGFGAR